MLWHDFTMVAYWTNIVALFLDTVDKDFRADIDAVYNSSGETDPVADPWSAS